MNNRINCTCGWSWNKSDSSKKDMYICHECGKNNKIKNGGWLDKYQNGGELFQAQKGTIIQKDLTNSQVEQVNNLTRMNFEPAFAQKYFMTEEESLLKDVQKQQQIANAALQHTNKITDITSESPGPFSNKRIWHDKRPEQYLNKEELVEGKQYTTIPYSQWSDYQKSPQYMKYKNLPPTNTVASMQQGGFIPIAQSGGTWEKQLERVRRENANKPRPTLTVAELIAEKKLKDQNIGRQAPIVQRDNTNVSINNRPELISKVARNKTDKEVADERKYKREISNKNVLNQYSEELLNTDNYTRQNLSEAASGLESKFRVSDEPNFFDDYLNPANMIGSMASNLGQAPLQAQQQDSYLPYVTSIGAPLAVGALAGIGAQNTGQFINNIANPLAGTGELFKGAGVLTKENALAKLETSIAPELRQGLHSNGFLDIFKSKFESEINWGQWNKEIPDNTQLMQEYNKIEQQAKAKGSWMKYSDGSDFNGTPEQFVQMNHPNTQSFAGGVKETEQMYKEPLYRGAHRHVVDFKNRDRNDYATFLTDNEKNAETYATSDGEAKKYFHPDVDKEVEVYGKSYPLEGGGKYQLSFPQNLPVVKGQGNGDNWRFLDYDKKIDITGNRAEINRNSFEGNLSENPKYSFDYPKSFDINKNYLSTDDYASYVKNNPTGIAKIENVKDQMGYVEGIPANTIYAVDAEKVPIKSLRYNNGMFDMTNPNIYKSVVPIAGASYLATQNEKEYKDGGIIKDDNGYWNPDNWGKDVEIDQSDPDSFIDMRGVYEPLIGVSEETGESKIMYPGEKHKFGKGTKKVIESPLAKNGLKTKSNNWLDKYC